MVKKDINAILRKILQDWNDLSLKFDNSLSNLLKRTEKYLRLKYKKEENDNIKSFMEIRNCFYNVDFHPLESGAYDELDKWDLCKKNMIELMKEIVNFT